MAKPQLVGSDTCIKPRNILVTCGCIVFLNGVTAVLAAAIGRLRSLQFWIKRHYWQKIGLHKAYLKIGERQMRKPWKSSSPCF